MDDILRLLASPTPSTRAMRLGPSNASRHPRSSTDPREARRAGIRALDCGDEHEPEPPRVAGATDATESAPSATREDRAPRSFDERRQPM